jgi:hypothetical protein
LRKWDLKTLCEELKSELTNAERRRREMLYAASLYETRVKEVFGKLVEARQNLAEEMEITHAAIRGEFSLVFQVVDWTLIRLHCAGGVTIGRA